MGISVAIATYNEEKNIESCLKSVASWVDEIVLVDGSSTDNTVEIAKKYKVNIIIVKNKSNFHLNKQKAIDNCSHEWILQLDADERVSEELREEILSAIGKKDDTTLSKYIQANSLKPINGFWLPRRNYFLGKFLKKGGQYPDYTLRLYKNGKGRLPCKSVHEQAIVEGKTGYFKNPLLHYPYPDFSHYLEHFNLYTSILAEEYKKDKVKINNISLLNFFFLKPLLWFFSSYFRHKGFLDGFPGFIFALFSSMRFAVAYIKYWENCQCDNERKK